MRCPRSGTTTSASTATGYPDGLRGEEIPLGARIIHVADALDSMLTSRIYRSALTEEDALAELRRGAGEQFCPRCVRGLEQALVIENETRDSSSQSAEPFRKLELIFAECVRRSGLVRDGALQTG